MNKFFTNADQFGALSQVSFFDGEKYKTVYGGILSLLIYSIGFSYFVYLIVMWQTDQIPPTITIQQQFDARPLYIFSLEVDESTEQIQELQQKGQIFQYKIGSYNLGGVNLTKNPIGFHCAQPTRNLFDYYDPICMNLQDKYQTDLIQNYMNRTQDSYVNVSVDYCDPKTNQKYSINLHHGGSHLSLKNWIQELEILQTQDYYFASVPYQNKSTISISLRIRKGTYMIDTGILFSNIRVVEVVRSIELMNQITQFTDINNNVPMIAYIDYHLDRNEEIITITYPKLGEVLADVGSIFQVLLFLGLNMYQFNLTRMQFQIEMILMEIYFPEIKVFKFKYNWKRQIKSISQMGELLNPFDFERMKQFRIETGKLLRSKLNSLNILHEISRLQIQSQLRTTRSESIQQQSLGYRVNLPKLGEDQIFDDEKERILDQRDFQILFLQKPESDETNNMKNIKKINKEELTPSDSFRLDEKRQVKQILKQNSLEFQTPKARTQQQLIVSMKNIPKLNTQYKSLEIPNLAIQDLKQIPEEGADQDLQFFNYDYEIPQERDFSSGLVIGLGRQNMNGHYPPTTKIKIPGT